jgi:hypothetical protein
MQKMQKVSALCGLILTLCVSAQGAMFGPYTSFVPSGYIAPDGDVVVSDTSPAISGLNTAIQNYTLTLTFQDLASVGGIHGALTLYLLSGVPNQSFDLSTFTTSDSYTYSETFTSGNLINLNPNTVWTLDLVASNPGDANTILNWSLDITAVPEPVNVALAVFGLCLAGVGAGRWALRRAQA